MSTVAEVIGTIVARLGVGHAFGVVGSGNFHVTNALRHGGVPFVATRHETGAAMMADAYARTSGDVAVLTVHQGCGLTNALTGIAEAAKSRTPLLVLAADTAGAAVRSNFRIDQDAAVRAVGAVSERVHTRGVGRRRRRARVRHLRCGSGARWCSTCRSTSRPPRASCPTRCRRWRRGVCHAPTRRRSRRSPRSSTGPSARCSSRAGAPAMPGPTWRRSPSGAARCWPPRRWRTGSSRATRGRWGSPAGSPPRWPSS